MNPGTAKNTFKSIGAVLAGFFTVFVLSVVTDIILEKLGVLPPPEQGLFITWILVLALFYRTIYTVAGGYVTATLAPGRPMRHAAILGVIGTIAGTIGVFVGWNLSQHWYPIALAVLGFPSVWLGGKLYVNRKGAQQ